MLTTIIADIEITKYKSVEEKPALKKSTFTAEITNWTIVENAILPVMYSAPSNKNIQKIIMDVDSKDNMKVVPTIIEKPKAEENIPA